MLAASFTGVAVFNKAYLFFNIWRKILTYSANFGLVTT